MKGAEKGSHGETQAAARWATCSWTLRSSRMKQHRHIKSDSTWNKCLRDSGSYSFLNPPAAVQSAADVSLALTSPCLICFPCTFFFFPPSSSCGNRICWAVFPLTSRSRSHLNNQPTRQFIKTQRHKGEDRQWGAPCAGSRPAGGVGGFELWRWQRVPLRRSPWYITNNESQEDVTKQIKSESLGFLWMKMKMCRTPLYCSSVPLNTTHRDWRQKIGFQLLVFEEKMKCILGVQLCQHALD